MLNQLRYAFLGQRGFEKAKKHAYLPLLECSSCGAGGQNETEGSTLKFMGCLSSKNGQRRYNQIRKGTEQIGSLLLTEP